MHNLDDLCMKVFSTIQNGVYYLKFTGVTSDAIAISKTGWYIKKPVVCIGMVCVC